MLYIYLKSEHVETFYCLLQKQCLTHFFKKTEILWQNKMFLMLYIYFESKHSEKFTVFCKSNAWPIFQENGNIMTKNVFNFEMKRLPHANAFTWKLNHTTSIYFILFLSYFTRWNTVRSQLPPLKYCTKHMHTWQGKVDFHVSK